MGRKFVYIIIGLFLIWLALGSIFVFYFRGHTSWVPSAEDRFSGDIEREDPVIADRNCMLSDVVPGSKEKDQTEILQRGIDECANGGGGTLAIPEGVWNTGPLELRSGVRLLLEKDARLVFSSDKKRYEKGVPNRLEGIEIVGLTPLLTARDCRDIAIAGEGIIDGGGSAWHNGGNGSAFENFIFARAYEAVSRGDAVEQRDYSSGEVFSRPDMLLVRNCDRVSLEGVTWVNSPRWMVHFLYSRHIVVRNMRMENVGDNTDDIVIDSSRDVLVENVNIQSGDDALVMKSGLGEDGRRVGIPTERVHIRGVSVDGAHGGIVIGSEMSGGVRDVLAENVSVKNAWSAIRIKAPDGRGGYVRNITVRGATYENISQNAIHLDSEYSYNAMAEEKSDVQNAPDIENLFFDNISGSGAQRIIDIDGLPEKPVRNIVMRSLEMQGNKGVSIKNVSGLSLTDSNLDIDFGKVKKKEVFSLENADRVFSNSVDCGSIPAEKCINVDKNSEQKSLFLEKGFSILVRGENIILGPKALLFPWHVFLKGGE